MPSAATAATWLSESFDTFTVGDLAGQGGWGGSGAIKVQTDFVKSGKSLEANYLLWGTGDINHSVSSGSGYHYIDFDAAMDVEMTPPGLPGSNLGYIRILTTSGTEITRVYFAYQQFKVLMGTSSQTVVVSNATNRNWYHFRLGIDLFTSRITVWVDGLQVAEGATHQPASAIERITIGQWDIGTPFTKTGIYVDNIVCTRSTELPPGAALRIISPMIPWTCWEAYNVLHPFVLYDDGPAGNYKMFYAGTAAAQASESVWDLCQTGIATSEDAVEWVRRTDNYEPVLYARKFWAGDVVDPEECSGVFDSIFAYGVCVIRDGPTYKMWYTGWNSDSEHIGEGLTKKINFRIGYATSTDTLNWTKHAGTAGAGSVIGLGSAGQADSKGAGQPYVLKEGGSYRMWYEGFDGSTWRILYATSSDGINWSKHGVAVGPGAAGSPDALGLRNPVVITRNGVYEMWYQGQSSSSPNFHVLRATSSDGLSWTKISGEVILNPESPVSGSERVHVDSIIVRPDNSCQVFFAKEVTTTRAMMWGTIRDRAYHIYTEAVNP